MASYLRVRPRTGDDFFHLRLAGHYADGLGCCQEMASNNDRVLAAGVTRRKSGTGTPMGEESDSGCDMAGGRPITGAVANRPARSLRVGRRKPGDFSPNWRTIGGQPTKSVSIASRLLIRLRQPALSYQLRGLLEKHTAEEYQAVGVATALWRQRGGERR